MEGHRQVIIIPDKLDMTYLCGGGTFAIAYPPYFIGTVIQNSMEHTELFGEGM